MSIWLKFAWFPNRNYLRVFHEPRWSYPSPPSHRYNEFRTRLQDVWHVSDREITSLLPFVISTGCLFNIVSPTNCVWWCILSTSVVHRRISSTASLQHATSSHAPAYVLAAVTATNSRGHVISLENEVSVSPAQHPGTVYHHLYMNSQTQSLSKNISKPICSLVPLVHSFYIHIVSCWSFL